MTPRPKLLIVDDVANNLFAMQAVLQDCDMEIIEASSGNEALLKAIQHKSFFLIFMDVQMPDMDGFETAKILRQDQQLAEIPIIFLTAYSRDDKQVLAAYEAGAVDYIQKPINTEILLSKVEIFKELWENKQQLKQQNIALTSINLTLENTTQALKTSNTDLAAFAGVVSHDLKAPLRQINSFSELINDELSEHLDETCRGYLNYIQTASQRSIAIINGLLEYSQCNQTKPVFSSVDLNEVISDVLKDLQNQLSDAVIEKDDLPTLNADRNQMYRVFLNLVGNAAKYRQKDTPLRIKILNDNETKKTDNSAKRNCTQVIIEDNGIGFDDKYVDKIFNPFTRLVSNKDFDGAGIGLGVVKKVMENHNGYVSASSQLSKGSRFVLTFR